LQITGELKMVARGAAGILKGKDLMVVEDAHEFFELPNPSYMLSRPPVLAL
jgi:hypothetical protein